MAVLASDEVKLMNILIANDGSEYGMAAVDLAANLINCGPGTKVKVIVVVEPAATLEVETLIESVDELTAPDNPNAKKAHEIGATSVRRLNDKCGINGTDISHEVLAGPAARTIVEKAEEWNADLIVVGSHGYGFWSRALLGSVSNRIASHANCSVLIARTKT